MAGSLYSFILPTIIIVHNRSWSCYLCSRLRIRQFFTLGLGSMRRWLIPFLKWLWTIYNTILIIWIALLVILLCHLKRIILIVWITCWLFSWEVALHVDHHFAFLAIRLQHLLTPEIFMTMTFPVALWIAGWSMHQPCQQSLILIINISLSLNILVSIRMRDPTCGMDLRLVKLAFSLVRFHFRSTWNTPRISHTFL